MVKSELKQHCLDLFDKEIEQIGNAIKDIEVSLTSESKSTAGDKHNTSRAMIQAEHGQLLGRRVTLLKQRTLLLSINDSNQSNEIKAGSLVQTEDGRYFYIASGLGKIEFKDEEVLVFSPVAPIAQLVLGKKKGETFNFMNEVLKIKAII